MIIDTNMVVLETPSRVWRRIEAHKQQDGDMPSLPSLPEAEDTELSESGVGQMLDVIIFNAEDIIGRELMSCRPLFLKNLPLRSQCPLLPIPHQLVLFGGVAL